MPNTLSGIYAGMPNGINFQILEKTSYVYKYRGETDDGKTIFWSSYAVPDAKGTQSGYKINLCTVVILEQGYETLP